VATDGVDDEAGHGTHVCGSILGNCLQNLTRLNGMAPEAQISFFDVGPLNSGGALVIAPSYAAIFDTARLGI